ncbi:relA-associated inhibitor [Danio aesculapii]|uniref:relA-associated inhibitor n=1 Tax=Danio aesculapii TaxID=1142201 RepID=UPI0024BF9DFA|nr:relA-associated inhibitor [Danio aesculapii]
MNSQGGFGSNLMFQSINNELNASLATADELSREFSSLLTEAAPVVQTTAQISSPRAQISNDGSSNSFNNNGNESPKTSFTQSPTSVFSSDPINSWKESNLNQNPSPQLSRESMKYMPSSPSPLTHQHSPFATRKEYSDSRYTFDQNMSPNTLRRTTQMPLRPQDRSTRGSLSYGEISSPTYDSKTPRSSLQAPSSPLFSAPRSPRLDRPPSSQSFSQPAASTLPRNFRHPEEGMQRPKNSSKWNESDLDASYERKPYHTYDKNEWVRPPVPNSSWKESSLDAPLPAKKETVPHSLPSYHHSSLPRNARISVPPDLSSGSSSPYSNPSISSRISVPPVSSGAPRHRPIPLSVIFRLQNPHHYPAAVSRYAPGPMGEPQQGVYHQHLPLPQDYMWQNQTPQRQQPQKQPAYYREVLQPTEVDAELEKLDLSKTVGPVSLIDQGMKPEEESKVEDQEIPRPLSPTRLQPVVAPQADLDTDLDELMRIRAEFPRALKKRSSLDISQPLPELPVSQPNYYKQMINKMFRRKALRIKEDPAAENSSSSDGEESSKSPVSLVPVRVTETISSEHKGIHSILRKGSKANKSASRRAHLSPLILMLDGSLVGELETVQRAAQKMSDPSQSNDEGITALHNAICGGHFPVVEFLVRIGANVSAPDSHGWTPLHCAASCNDRQMSEFLVRNGAAVMAVTDSDGATASQKCDPYAPGYEECESLLRGVEEAMGVENSGVVYALWGYPAQAPDELSFKEGDMVTILQKPEGEGWWWASLCGREGFVPNNYFGLFPKVRPKTLC